MQNLKNEVLEELIFNGLCDMIHNKDVDLDKLFNGIKEFYDNDAFMVAGAPTLLLLDYVYYNIIIHSDIAVMYKDIIRSIMIYHISRLADKKHLGQALNSDTPRNSELFNIDVDTNQIKFDNSECEEDYDESWDAEDEKFGEIIRDLIDAETLDNVKRRIIRKVRIRIAEMKLLEDIMNEPDDTEIPDDIKQMIQDTISEIQNNKSPHCRIHDGNYQS